MNRTLSDWVSSYKPVILCNATAKVEEICAKNGLTFTEFLRPYFHSLDTIKSLTIKSIGRENDFRTFGFRLVHVNEFRPVELNPYDGNHHGFISDNIAVGDIDKQTNSALYMENQVSSILTRSQAKSSTNNIHESMISTRELLFETSRYNEFDLTDQPVAIVQAVSSSDLNAEVKFDELRSRAAQPLVFRNGVYDKNVQIIHLIINDHDVTCQMDVLDLAMFYISKECFVPITNTHEEISLPHIMTKTLFMQMLLGPDATVDVNSNEIVLSPLAKEILLRLDGQGKLPSSVHGELEEDEMHLVQDPLNIWKDRQQYQAIILNGLVLPTKLPATTWLRLRQSLADIESQRHKAACGITQNQRTILSSAFNSQKQDIMQLEVNSLGSSVCIAELLSDVGLKQCLVDRFGQHLDLEHMIMKMYPIHDTTPTEIIDPQTLFNSTNNHHSKKRASTIVQNPFLISNGNVGVYQPNLTTKNITIDIASTSLLYQHPNLNVPVTIPDAKSSLSTHQRYVKMNAKKRIINQSGRIASLANLCFPIYNSIGIKRTAHLLRDMKTGDITKKTNTLGVYYQTYSYLHGYGFLQSVENIQNITYCIGMMVTKAIVPSIETKIQHMNTLITEKKLGFKNTVRNLFGRKDKHAVTFPDAETKCLTSGGKQQQSLWESSTDLMSAASESIGLFGGGAPHEDCESTRYAQQQQYKKCEYTEEAFQAQTRYRESHVQSNVFWDYVPCPLPVSRPQWATHAFRSVDEVRGTSIIDAYQHTGDPIPISYTYQPYALVINNTYLPHQILPAISINSLEGGLYVQGCLCFVLQDFSTCASLLKSHLNDLKTDITRSTVIPIVAPAYAQLTLSLAQFLLDTSGDQSLSKDAFDHLELSQALFTQAEVLKQLTKTDSLVIPLSDCIHQPLTSSTVEQANCPVIFRNSTKHLPSYFNYATMTGQINAIFLDLLVHPSAFPATIIPIASPKPKDQTAISLYTRMCKLQKCICAYADKEFLRSLDTTLYNERHSFVSLPFRIADPSRALLLAYSFEQAAIACCSSKEYLTKKHQLYLFLAGIAYYQCGMFKLSLRCFLSLLPMPVFKAVIDVPETEEELGVDSDSPSYYAETSILNTPTILSALYRYMILGYCALNSGDKAFTLFHMFLGSYKYSTQLTRYMSFYAYSHSIAYQERLSARKLPHGKTKLHKLFHLTCHDDSALTLVNRQLYTSLESLYIYGVAWLPTYKPIAGTADMQMQAINASYSVASQFQTNDVSMLPDGCLYNEKNITFLKFDTLRLHIHAGSQLHGDVSTWSDAVALSPETLFRCKANTKYYTAKESRDMNLPDNCFTPQSHTSHNMTATAVNDVALFVKQFIGGDGDRSLQFPLDVLYAPYVCKTRFHTSLRNEPQYVTIPVINPLDCNITVHDLKPRLCYINPDNDRIIPYCCTFPAPLVESMVLSLQPKERAVVQFEVTPIAEGSLQLFGFSFTMNDALFYTPLVEEFPVYPSAHMSCKSDAYDIKQRLPNPVSVCHINETKAPLIIGRTSALPTTTLSYQSPYGLLGGVNSDSTTPQLNDSLLERHSALFGLKSTVLHLKGLYTRVNTRHLYPDYAYSTQSIYPSHKDNKHHFQLESLLQGEASSLTYNTPFLAPESSELYPSLSVNTTKLPKHVISNGAYSVIQVLCPSSELVVSNAFTSTPEYHGKDTVLDWDAYAHSNTQVAPYLPLFMLQGSVLKSTITLTNNGPVPTSQLQFKTSHPHMVCFSVNGQELPLNYTDGVLTLKYALMDGESINVELTVRGNTISMNTFTVLIYYTTQDQRERLIRLSQPLLILPCMNVHIHQPSSLQLLASVLKPESTAVVVEMEDIRPLLIDIFPVLPDFSVITTPTHLQDLPVNIYLYAILHRLLSMPLKVSTAEVFSLTHRISKYNLDATNTNQDTVIPFHGSASTLYLTSPHDAPKPLQLVSAQQKYIVQRQPSVSVYKSIRSVLGNIVHSLRDSGVCTQEELDAAEIHAITGNPFIFRNSVHLGYFPFFSDMAYWSGTSDTQTSPSESTRMAAHEALLWHEAEHCTLIVNPRAHISSFASLYNSQWFFRVSSTTDNAPLSSVYVPGVFINKAVTPENPKQNIFVFNTPRAHTHTVNSLLPGFQLHEKLIQEKPYLSSLVHKSEETHPLYTTGIYPPQPLPILSRPARQANQYALAYIIQQYNSMLLPCTMQLLTQLHALQETKYFSAISRTCLYPNILVIPNVHQMKGLAFLKYLALHFPHTHEDPNVHRCRVLLNDNAVKHVDSYTRLHCLTSSTISIAKAYNILRNPIQAYITCDNIYQFDHAQNHLTIPITVTLNYIKHKKDAKNVCFKAHFLQESVYTSICTNVLNNKLALQQNYNPEEVLSLAKVYSSSSNKSEASSTMSATGGHSNIGSGGKGMNTPLVSPRFNGNMPMLQSPKLNIPNLPSLQSPKPNTAVGLSTTLKTNHSTPLPLIPSLQSLNAQAPRNIEGVEVVARPVPPNHQFHTQYIAPEHNFGYLIHTSVSPDTSLNAEKGVAYIEGPLAYSREKVYDEPLQLIPIAHAEQCSYTISGATLQYFEAFEPNHTQSYQVNVHISSPGIYDLNKLVIEILPDDMSPISVLHYNENPCIIQVV